MGDNDEAKDASKTGYVFLISLCKIGAGVCGSIFMSYFAAATIPISILMGYCYCVVCWAFDMSGKGVITYMIFMALWNLAWIMAATEYDSRMPSSEMSNSYLVYLGLFVFTAIDMYLIKKKLHKWAHKCTSGDLRKEYKALKREKKQRKLMALMAKK